jgi:hypothetical protein
MDAYKKEYTTLGVGGGGVHATAPSQWSDTTAQITIYDRRLTPYFGDLVEGGVVIDKRPCVDRDDYVKMVVSGPILQESLPPGHKNVFDYGSPRTIIPCTTEDKFSGLDYVSLDIYLALWSKMGAKIGKRVGDEIHWENGEITSIPPAELRWKFDS